MDFAGSFVPPAKEKFDAFVVADACSTIGRRSARSAAGSGLRPRRSAEPTKLVFSLDFIPLGRHAPWYAALAEGYFKDEGLDVSIIPSQGGAQVIQNVDSGTADMGFMGVPEVAIARATGSPIKMVAVNYQKIPIAVFSLAKRRQCSHHQTA